MSANGLQSKASVCMEGSVIESVENLGGNYKKAWHEIECRGLE